MPRATHFNEPVLRFFPGKGLRDFIDDVFFAKCASFASPWLQHSFRNYFGLLVQILFGRRTPWLPQWVLRISFKRSFMEKMVPAGILFLSKTEALVRPRLRWFTGRVGQLLPVFWSC